MVQWGEKDFDARIEDLNYEDLPWGCQGFDLETKHKLHAEDVGWPPKKTDTFLNGNSHEELALAA
jgi:hypothetical protein